MTYPERIDSASIPYARNGRLPAGSAGYSIIELVVVVAIISTLVTIAIPAFQSARDLAKVARAEEEVRAIEKVIINYSIDNGGAFPPHLSDANITQYDPWGNAYGYAVIPAGGTGRIGHWGDPLNTDFDLFSSGANGVTAPPDTATGEDIELPANQDDIIRASNGSFVGLARIY